MPSGHNKIGSGRPGRILRIGRDLFSIALEDRLLGRILVSVLGNDGRPFLGRDQKRFCDLVLQVTRGSTEDSWSNGTDSCGAASCADRKKRIAAEPSAWRAAEAAMKEAEKAATKMAKEDAKTIKKLERRRDAAMAEGNRILAWECHAAIQSLQGRKS
jgi:hypothetical protein